jgi:hypothetical protein
MEQKEAVLYQATKMFNWTETEAKERLFDGEELKEDYTELLLEADKARIQKLKDERTTYHDNGYKEAEKKFKSHAEETFKKLTGYTGAEDNFEAMFQAWHKEETKRLAQKKEVTEDDIKRHPLYVKLESETILKAEYDKLQKSFDEFKTEKQRSEVMGVVTGRAWDVVAQKNPILSENQTVAENRKRDFLAKFSGYDYDLQEGKIIVLKDEKRLEDEHGNLLPFESFVMDLANLNFDFRAQDDKGNAGNRKPGGNNVIAVSEKPTTKDEYNAAMAKHQGAGDEEARARIAIKKYYDANKKD